MGEAAMRETTDPSGAADPIPTREWIKGLVAIAVVIGITILLPLLLLYGASTCGCTTRPG